MSRESMHYEDLVAKFTTELAELDKELAMIQEENQEDDVNRQIIEYESAARKNNAEIAAEDAMDSVVRLQNQLKIAIRRNELLARESKVQEKQLRERVKLLKKHTDELDMLCEVTGWHENFNSTSLEDIEKQGGNVHEMAVLEAQIRQELKQSKVIIKKKEDAIVKLQAQLDAGKEMEISLNKVYNDILVKQRDIREAQAKLKRLQLDDGNMERALVEMQESDGIVINSVECMEADKEFLSDAVGELKVATRRQDAVVQAQIARQEQLQKRLDLTMRSLQEMKLQKEFERNVSKSALVPSASREEPQSVAEVLPEEEFIPIDTYRLLYKNNEMMRTSVARKNMLVLEKESAIQALEAKLGKYIESHNARARQEDSMSAGKTNAMNELMGTLQREHQKHRNQIEDIKRDNYQLKQQLNSKIKAASSVKRVSVRR